MNASNETIRKWKTENPKPYTNISKFESLLIFVNCDSILYYS